MISFAGDGWGAVAALKSLQVKFGVIEVCSNDHDVLALIRLSERDKKINSLSLSKSELVVCAGYKAFISKKELSQKEGFGGRAIVNDFYMLNFSND